MSKSSIEHLLHSRRDGLGSHGRAVSSPLSMIWNECVTAQDVVEVISKTNWEKLSLHASLEANMLRAADSYIYELEPDEIADVYDEEDDRDISLPPGATWTVVMDVDAAIASIPAGPVHREVKQRALQIATVLAEAELLKHLDLRTLIVNIAHVFIEGDKTESGS